MSRSRRTPMNSKAQARAVSEVLKLAYPEAVCALVHSDPYQLLVATILSAQCTDARVNLVTPELFRRYPDPSRLAKAQPAELEALIRSTGFYRAKARNLLAMAEQVVERHDGRIPMELEALTALNGVGRKTANVVLGTAFGIAEGVVVDTHVKRLAHRLGMSKGKTPEQIERDLMKAIPREDWVDLSHRLIQHGRKVCFARRPRCETCAFSEICPRIGVAIRPRPKGTLLASRRASGRTGTESPSA
ncbi:MAG: endonuclease III [Isosphaeraceae bacterium]